MIHSQHAIVTTINPAPTAFSVLIVRARRLAQDPSSYDISTAERVDRRTYSSRGKLVNQEDMVLHAVDQAATKRSARSCCASKGVLRT